MYKSYVLAAATLLSGCSTINHSESESVRELRATRRAESSLPLEARVNAIEKKMFSEFLDAPTGLITYYNVRKDGRVDFGPIQLEHNAHLLIGLCAKYGVTKDHDTKSRIGNLLRGLDKFDSLNGHDGYYPNVARREHDELTITDNHSLSMVYTQLLFGHLLAHRIVDDEKIKKHAATQALTYLSRFAKNDFIHKDEVGKKVRYSDASAHRTLVVSSRELETLNFINAGLFLAREHAPQLVSLFEEKRKIVEEKYGYLKKPIVLRINLGIYQVPTPSTSWLDMMKLGGLIETTQESESINYKFAMRKLSNSLSDHKNPFFMLMEALYSPNETNSQLIAASYNRINTYPLTNTFVEIRNSNRSDVPKRLIPRFVKNQAESETTKVLPIYDVAGDSYQWKRNPFAINGNVGSDGSEIYNGVDFYEVYWLMQLAEVTSKNAAVYVAK